MTAIDFEAIAQGNELIAEGFEVVSQGIEDTAGEKNVSFSEETEGNLVILRMRGMVGNIEDKIAEG